MDHDYLTDLDPVTGADAVRARPPTLGRRRVGRFDGGVVMIVALVGIGALAVLTFSTLLGDVARHNGLVASDLPTVRALAATRGPLSVAAMRLVSTAGSPTAMCVVAAGVCGLSAWRWRVTEPLVLCLITVVAVGFSRVFLGAHYPSDVLAGWSLAVGWDAVVVLALVFVRPGSGAS